MDEDLQRKEHILNIILVGSIVMLAILDASVLFYSIRDGAAYSGIPFAVFSVLPAFFIFLYILSRRGFASVASYLLIAAYLASDSYAAYRWGVGMQMVLIAYALIIVMATILCGTKFGFFCHRPYRGVHHTVVGRPNPWGHRHTSATPQRRRCRCVFDPLSPHHDRCMAL